MKVLFLNTIDFSIKATIIVLPHPDENRVSIFVILSDFFHLFVFVTYLHVNHLSLFQTDFEWHMYEGGRRQQDWCPDLLTNGNFSHFPTYIKQTLYNLEQTFSRFISRKNGAHLVCVCGMICQNIRQLWWHDNKIACNMLVDKRVRRI